VPPFLRSCHILIFVRTSATNDWKMSDCNFIHCMLCTATHARLGALPISPTHLPTLTIPLSHHPTLLTYPHTIHSLTPSHNALWPSQLTQSTYIHTLTFHIHTNLTHTLPYFSSCAPSSHLTLTFHTLTTPSTPPVTTYAPSWENLTIFWYESFSAKSVQVEAINSS